MQDAKSHLLLLTVYATVINVYSLTLKNVLIMSLGFIPDFIMPLENHQLKED